MNTSRDNTRRDRGSMSQRHCERSEAIHLSTCTCRAMDCSATPATTVLKPVKPGHDQTSDAACRLKRESELLLRHPRRELAVADANRKSLDEFCDRILAVGSDQFGKGCEQACLREAIAIDAVVPRLRPGFVEIAQRRLFLLLIGQG